MAALRPISKKEKYLFYNTLTGLVKNLENCYTAIDLRNECCVTGKIAKVDGYMNVEMEDVFFYDTKGNKKHLETFFLSSRNIRNVNIPEQKDAITLLRGQPKPVFKKRQQGKRTFKASRAVKRNAETVAEAYGDGNN